MPEELVGFERNSEWRLFIPQEDTIEARWGSLSVVPLFSYTQMDRYNFTSEYEENDLQF
jgi:hypothetical protein